MESTSITLLSFFLSLHFRFEYTLEYEIGGVWQANCGMKPHLDPPNKSAIVSTNSSPKSKTLFQETQLVGPAARLFLIGVSMRRILSAWLMGIFWLLWRFGGLGCRWIRG